MKVRTYYFQIISWSFSIPISISTEVLKAEIFPSGFLRNPFPLQFTVPRLIEGKRSAHAKKKKIDLTCALIKCGVKTHYCIEVGRIFEPVEKKMS